MSSGRGDGQGVNERSERKVSLDDVYRFLCGILLSEQEWIDQLEVWFVAATTITYWSVILRARVRKTSAVMFRSWQGFFKTAAELSAYFGIWALAIFLGTDYVRTDTNFYIAIAQSFADTTVFPDNDRIRFLGLEKSQWLKLSNVSATTLAFVSFIFHFVRPIQRAFWMAFTSVTQKTSSQPVLPKRAVSTVQLIKALTVAMTFLTLIIIAVLFVIGPEGETDETASEQLSQSSSGVLIWGVSKENAATFIEGMVILITTVLLALLVVKPLLSQIFAGLGTISPKKNRIMNAYLAVIVAITGLYVFFTFMLDAAREYFS